MLKALYEVVSKAGGNMGETSKSSILSLIEDDLDVDDGTAILPLNPCHGRFGHFPLTEVALGGVSENGYRWGSFTRSSSRASISRRLDTSDTVLLPLPPL